MWSNRHGRNRHSWQARGNTSTACESEVSWDGVYDRRSIEKDAMVAVTTVFTVE